MIRRPPRSTPFPTRRSSDLPVPGGIPFSPFRAALGLTGTARLVRLQQDRKSTRLNSSHSSISYAVFCLKKKKKNKQYTQRSPDPLIPSTSLTTAPTYISDFA